MKEERSQPIAETIIREYYEQLKCQQIRQSGRNGKIPRNI